MFAARLIPGIDLIVGGHSHTFLWSNCERPAAPKAPATIEVRAIGSLVP